MSVVQQDAVNQQMHLLPFQSAERRPRQWLLVIGLRDALVIQEAPQALFFGVLGRIERQGTRDLAELGR